MNNHIDELIKKFKAMPTSDACLVVAAQLEELGDLNSEIVRDSLLADTDFEKCYSSATGLGSGLGYGEGSGEGHGRGYGDGYGIGGGEGDGCGFGCGDGVGFGAADGSCGGTNHDSGFVSD